MSFESILANPIFGFSIRGAQFIFGLLAFILGCVAADKFSTAGGVIWTIISGIISVIYLVVIFLLRRIRPHVLIPGALIIAEGIQAIFFFCAFVATAAQVGDVNCSWFENSSWGIYGLNKSACQSSKAAIAFASFNFALFSFTTVLFGFYVVKPSLATDPTGAKLFQTNGQTGFSFNPAILILSTDSASSPSDEETKIGTDAATEPKVEDDDPIEDQDTRTGVTVSV
jgi:hypothetical protein